MENNNKIPANIKRYLKDLLVKQLVNESFRDQINYLLKNNPELLESYSKAKLNEENKEKLRIIAEKESDSSNLNPLNWDYNWARKWMNDIKHQDTEGAMAKLMDNSFELEQIENIKDYNNLVEQRSQLLEQKRNGLNVDETLSIINNQIQQYDEWFKGDGRRSEVVRNTMFSRDNVSNGETYAAYISNDALNLAEDFYNKTKNGVSTLETLSYGIHSLSSALWDITVGAGKHLFSKNKEFDYAINTARNEGASKLFLDKAYIGSYIDPNNTTSKGHAQLRSSVANLNKYNENLNSKKLSLIDDVNEKLKLEQDGKFNLLGIPFLTMTYDTNIDEKWQKEDELFNGLSDVFSMPGHWAASTASTVGLFKYLLLTIGYEALAKQIISSLGEIAITKSGNVGRLAKGAQTLTKVSIPVVGIRGAVKSREAETALEAVGAYTDRIVQTAEQNGADFSKVYPIIEKKLHEVGGDRFDKLSMLDKMKMACVMGIETGDDLWDNAVTSSQHGLLKLINANNSLAFGDYIETIPYMPYTGRVVKNLIQRNIMRGTVGKLRNASDDVFKRFESSGKLDKAIEQSFLSPNGWLSRQIDKGANWFIKKDHVKAAMRLKDISKYAVNRLPFAVGQSISEGIEEGQLELLQQRYKRGEYDGQYMGDPFFSLNEVLQNIDLGLDAVGDYLGINHLDLDNGSSNLRKAMNIGFSSSLLFSNATHTLSNFTNPGDSNFRTLLKDLKSSNIARQIVLDDIEHQDLNEHANIYYEAARKGISAEQLKLKILYLKNNSQSGSEVTQDMIDLDKDLIDNIFYMYNNRALADVHREHSDSKRDKVPSWLYRRGIYGEDHKFDILNGALELTKLDQLQKSGGKDGKSINKIQRDNAYLLDVLLDPSESQEKKQEIINNFPHIAKLFTNFEAAYNKKNTERNQQMTETKDAIKKLLNHALNDPSSLSDIRDELQKAGLSVDTFESELLLIASGNANVSSAVDNIYKNSFSLKFNSDLKEKMDAAVNSLSEEDRKDTTKVTEARRNAFLSSADVRGYARRRLLGSDRFSHNRQMEIEINRMLNGIFDNNENENFDELANEYLDFLTGELDRNIFFHNMLREYHVHMQTNALNAALAFAKNQQELLDDIKKRTGMDIDTTRLAGIIDELKNVVAKNQTKLNSIYKKAEDNPFMSNEYEFDDDETKNYKDILKGFYLKRGLIGPYRQTISAYQYGTARPTTLRDAIYGKDNTEGTEFDDLAQEFNTKSKEFEDAEKNEDVLESYTKKNAARSDMQTIAKRTAWEYLKKRRETAAKNFRINRRNEIEDGLQSQGLDSSQEAVQHVDEVLNPQAQEKPKRTQSQMSAGEKQLREQYLHENTSSQLKKDDAIQRRLDEIQLQKEKEEENSNQREDDATESNSSTEQPVQQTSILAGVVTAQEEHNLDTDQDAAPESIDLTLSQDTVQDQIPEEIGISQEVQDLPQTLDLMLASATTGREIILYLYHALDGNHITFKLTTSVVKGKRSYKLEFFEGSRQDNPIVIDLLTLDGYDNEVTIPQNEYYIVRSVTITEESGDIQQMFFDVEDPYGGRNVYVSKKSTPIVDEASEIAKREAEEAVQRNIDELLNQMEQDSYQEINEDDTVATIENLIQQQQDNQESELDQDYSEFDDQINTQGWLEIDNFQSLYIDDNGNLMYNDELVPQDQAEYIKEDLSVLGLLENGQITLNQIPLDDRVNGDTKRQNVSPDFIGNYLSNTFFYAVDDRNTKSLADSGTVDTFNGAKLPKVIGTAQELSQKLSTKGWFNSTKKYYIVTKSSKVDKVANKDHEKDALTVSLIIEDDEKCYIASLRDLGIMTDKDSKGKTVTINNELHWRNWLQSKNLNIQKVEQALGHPLSLDSKKRQSEITKVLSDAIKNRVKKAYEAQSRYGTDEGFEDFYTKGQVVANNQALLSTRKAMIDAARRLTLLEFGLNRSSAMDELMIDEQIEKLRLLRNQIIDLYGNPTSGSEVRTDVVPDFSQQSNGRINNIRKNGMPVLRPIVGDNTSLSELTDKIENGDFQFGMGRGALSTDRFAIVPLLDGDQHDTSGFEGLGRSGKIYLYVPSLLDRAQKGKKIPLMLTEHKFNTQVRIKDGKRETRYGIVPCLKLNPDGTLINAANVDKDGYEYLPSEAEVLFYMITHKLDFGERDENKINSIIEFFIHTGDKTLFTKNARYGDQLHPDSSIFRTFSSKQIAYGIPEGSQEALLQIAMPDPSGNGYTVRIFTESALFAQTEEGETIRKQCIEAIANQMHWNTDKAHINTNINPGSQNRTEISQFIRHLFNTQAKSLREYNDNIEEYLNQEVSIMDCPDLTFRLGDFYEANPESVSDPIKPKSVNTLAWMMKNGKLVTDVGDPIFKDPFIFAFGAHVEQKQTNTNLSVPKPPVQPTEHVQEQKSNPFFKQSTLNSIFEQFGDSEEDKEHVAQNEDERKTLLKKLRGNAVDNILVDTLDVIDNSITDSGSTEYIDTIDETIQDKVNEVVALYKKQHNIPNEINIRYSSNFENEQDLVLDGSRKITIKVINNNGEYSATIGTTMILDLADSKSFFTGVYKTITGKYKKRKGKVDVADAKRWLKEKLGIENYNVIVSNAAIKGAQGDAFGVTNLAIDAITGELVGRIGLSTINGSNGVQFHEAWHYVNLLLHNREQRQAIYDEYLKYHKELRKKGITYKDVEEAMAELFLDYMLGKLDQSLSGKIKRFFRNAMDYVNLVLDRKRYRLIFDKIQNGKYNLYKIEQDLNIHDFLMNFEDGINKISYDTSGFTREQLDKLQYIDTHTQLFEGIDSIINYSLLVANLKTLEDMYDFAKGDMFSRIVRNIDTIINDLKGDFEEDELDDSTIESILILRDIKNNSDVLKASLIQKFQQMGFEAKFKTIERKQKLNEDSKHKNAAEDGHKKEDDPDNTWDKLELSESRKDNAGTRVKFFLATIPLYETRLDKKGNLKSYAKKDRFGVTKLWDFDRVWSAMAEDLSACSSYGEMVNGKFDRYSIRGIVKRLASVNTLYNSIDKKLDMLEANDRTKRKEDSELKSLLFGIFNAHRNHIQTIDLLNPYEAANIDLDTMGEVEEERAAFTTAVADVNKTWNFSDDGLYNPGWSLPRRWSQNLLSLGLSKFDPVTKQTVVSDQYAAKVTKMLDGLRKLILEVNIAVKNDKTGTSVDILYQNALYSKQKIVPKLINLLNTLGMPVDASVLSLYVAKKAGVSETRKLSASEVFDVISRLVSANNKKTGSISYVINAINGAIGKSEIKMKDSQGKQVIKQIDGILDRFSLDSDIGQIALAYSATYPSLKEMSAKSAAGDNLYPVNLNNYLSDKVALANKQKKSWSDEKTKVPYNKHSIIAAAVELIKDGIEESKLRLNTFVGMRNVSNPAGSDYLQITPMEDYLAKMMMIENDNIIFPTMADKKTWYSLSIGASSKKTKELIGDQHRFHMPHDVIITNVSLSDILDVAMSHYMTEVEEFDESKHKNLFTFKNSTVNEWYKSLDENIRESFKQEAQYKLQQNNPNFRRFSNETLDIFCGYFMDELNSLIEYYHPNNIKALVEDPNRLIENFHGSVKDGKMDFGGNGGKFRYFYDVVMDVKTSVNMNGNDNLNQTLQALYLLEQLMIKGKVSDRRSHEGEMYPNVSMPDSDGFNLIRNYLQELKNQVTEGNDVYTEALRSAMNEKLLSMTRRELERISDPNSPLYLVLKTSDGRFRPRAIPAEFLSPYISELRKQNRADYSGVYTPVNVASNFGNEDALFSLIANYVTGSAISIIEVEKIFSGDPAYYKYKNKKDADGNTVKEKATITYTLEDGSIVEETVQVDVLDDAFGDKIKRLGGTLSPGTELRLDYSESEIQKDIETVRKYFKTPEEVNGQAILGGSKYTVLDVEDIKCQSEVLDFIEHEFKKQCLVDLIRCGKVKTDETVDDIYFKQGKFESLYERVKDNAIDDKGTTVEEFVTNEVDAMSSPYKKITVADALVFIRPAMYRKIRKSLGDWTSADEEAYWIMETSDDWMSDPIKARKVRKFQQYALKMSYFANDVKRVTQGINLSVPMYNKMAIFPLFKFQRSTDTGRALYNRMNLAGNEIDMIAFKSAVKVGAVQNGLLLINEHTIEKAKSGDAEAIKNATSHLSEKLNAKSNVHLNYNTDEEFSNLEPGTLAVKVQDLHNLRLLLNTHAHEDMFRAIGTLMFKIAFSNTFDEEYYGNGKDGRSPRKGKDIKKDIIRLINQLTEIGAQSVKDRFFTIDEFGNEQIDEEAIKSYVQAVIQNNNLGAYAEEIINNGGKIASLMSRTVFEQSVSKLVNEDVVNINTPGGTAIQQSMIGFGEYSKSDKNIIGYGDEYIEYNNGLNLKWNANEGSMEVILSIKFFKGVVPKEFQHSPQEMRQWLIDHDIIKGYKTDGYEELSAEDKRSNENLALDLSVLELDESIKLTIIEYVQNGNDERLVTILDALKKYENAFEKKSRQEPGFNKKKATSALKEAIQKLGLTMESTPVKLKSKIGKEMSNPKPFGIGYRIPTQGMSSMFTFTVADVLPDNVGDLIIVPREFTAQTGSDFDVDKLYLSTLSYSNGELEREATHNTTGAYTNELLLDYMDIISDPKNFAQSRGSIDVFTDILKEKLLPKLRYLENTYLVGASQLLPSFLAYRKMEFATGKFGIGPFALNVTNLALTLYTHLTIDFGQFNEEDNTYGEFHLMPLDSVSGKDNRLISGWLSAMVNAHVDVAKDPYIFDLNVNQTTYNMANFLIRTGNGMSTFAFLAQPILKLYAQTINQNSGIYGRNINGNQQEDVYKASISRDLKSRYLKRLKESITELAKYVWQDDQVLQYSAQVYAKFEFDLNKSKKDGESKAPKLNVRWDKIISQDNNFESLDIVKRIKINRVLLDSLLEAEQKDETKILKLRLQIASDECKHYQHLLLTMLAFEKLSTYAQAMSSMVTSSQVDTKKFGNDLVSQKLWYNKYLNLRHKHNVKWILNIPDFYENVPKDKSGKPDSQAASDKALDTYFEELYLSDKLEKAMHYTKSILQCQTIVATNIFEDAFLQVLKDIYGEQIYEDSYKQENGKPVIVNTGFKPMVREENAKAIANGMENIARFNWFMHYGSHVYENEMLDNPQSSMIDFTFGNDRQALIDKINELYFGANDVPSIFERIASIKRDMRQNPDKKTSDGKRAYVMLVNRNGEIQNEFLNYIDAMMPTSQYPVGRIMLNESQMNVPSNIKRRYMSAFSLMLSHSNDEIRNLARDLVYFAYFSTYDQNTPGSFFDLVPPKYRAQYDEAIKLGFNDLSDPNLRNVSERAMFDADSQRVGIDKMKDILARNYWYNDDLVSPYNYYDDEAPEDSPSIFTKKNGETIIGEYYDQDARWYFPGAVISSRLKNDADYFKLQHNGASYLYKKIGVIHREAKEGKREFNPMYVYVMIPKAGMRQKGISLFEFYTDYAHDSIFSLNRIPAKFAEDEIRKSVEKKVKLFSEHESKIGMSIDWFTGTEVIPQRRKTNLYAYNPSINDSGVNRSSVGATKLQIMSDPNANPEYAAQRAAGVIINITSDYTSELTKNINQRNEEKTFNLLFGRSVDETMMQWLNNLLQDKLANGESEPSPIVVHISSNLSDYGFSDVSKLNPEIKSSIEEETERIIKERVEQYKNELDEESDDVQNKQALVIAFESDLRSESSVNKIRMNEATVNVMNQWLSEIISELLQINTPITTISTSASQKHTLLSRALSSVKCNSSNMTNTQPVVYLSPSWWQAKDLKRSYDIYWNKLKQIYSTYKQTLQESVISEEEFIKLAGQKVDEKLITQTLQSVESTAQPTLIQDNKVEETLPIIDELKEGDENAQNIKCGGILGGVALADEEIYDI